MLLTFVRSVPLARAALPLARAALPLARAALGGLLLLPPAGLLASAPRLALAAQPASMKLVRVTVSGNHQVPTAAIRRAMTIHPGETVTRADLQANLNAIVDVYRKANVGASFKQRLTISPNGRTDVAYLIAEQAPQAAPAPAVLRVDHVTFEGNKAVSSDAIRSVITLRPGQPVSNADVAANMQAIMQLYRKKNVGVTITPNASYPAPNQAVIDYRIAEKG